MRELIVPKKLNRGDTVAFISISGGRAGDPDMLARYETGRKRFEDILLDRFKPYYGKTYTELLVELGAPKTKAKSKYYLIANEILTERETRGEDVTKSDEFIKSGIVIKTIRLNRNGRPAEAMSFENINYFDILQEDDWYESRLYDIFTGRCLFIVFQEGDDEQVRLQKAF